MPESNEAMNLIDREQAALLRQENGLVREIIAAYEQARRDLLADFTERYQAMGDNPQPAAIRQLASDLNLMRAIEQRMAQLQGQVQGTLTEGLTEAGQEGWETAASEVDMMAQALDIELIRFGIDPDLELTIRPAIEQVPGLVSTMQSSLTAALREGLASGDRFSTLTQQVYGRNQGIWPRGRQSAELLTRRAVIQANNNARLLFYENAKEQIPDIQKQAIATIQKGRTTETCMRVHGQIREIDEPFETKGREAFTRWQQQPPFHWNCRTSVRAYHPIYDENSNFTTRQMISAAERAMGDQQVASNLDEDIADILEDVFDPFAAIRPPAGRAPRGLGQEYKDRRAIVNRINTQIKHRSQLQTTIANYRGQKNRRGQIDRATLRVQELNKAIEATFAVANNGGDWAFKREMVDGVFAYVSEITRQP